MTFDAIRPALSLAPAIGAVGVLVLFAFAHGYLRRRLPGRSVASQLLGAMLGAVSVLLAHAAQAGGGLVDLRLVPVILAGAFLGARGLLVCLLVAAAGRITLAGATLASDLVAMMLAGGAGRLWDGVTAGRARRGTRAMLGLVAVASIHHLALLLLPVAAVGSVLPGALSSLAASLAIVPIVGRLLERERLAALADDHARALTRLRPDRGFPTLARLQGDLSDALAGGRFEGGVAVLRIELRPGLAHARFWGDDVTDLVLRTLRRRITPLLPDGAIWGMIGAGRLIVVLPKQMGGALDGFIDALRGQVAAAPVDVPGAPSARPRLRLDRVGFDDLPPPAVLFAPGDATDAPLPAPPPGPGDRRLFVRAERLLAHQRLEARRASFEIEAGTRADAPR